MASTATAHGPTSSQPWKSASEGVWVTLAFLLRHLTPHLLCYSVHLSRTERYCLLVTGCHDLQFLAKSGVRCACCLPELWILHGLGQTDALSGWHSTIVHHHLRNLQALQQALRAWLSHTPRKEKSILRRCATCGRVGCTLVVAVHLLCVLMMLRTTQFFASVILWIWVRGCVLSAVTMTMSSPVVRALSFIRFALRHYAVHGRRTL